MVVVVFNKFAKGSMKEAISMGAKEILEKPSLSRTLSSTLLMLYQRESFLREDLKNENKIFYNEWNGNVISVFSPKGGVGKTTITTNTTAMGVNNLSILAT
jgi:pilus assembly protein CpaE